MNRARWRRLKHARSEYLVEAEPAMKDSTHTCPVCGRKIEWTEQVHACVDGETVWTEDLAKFWKFRRWSYLVDQKERGE